MSVNIKATFKRDDRELNGLEHIAKELVDQPMKRHIVIGMIEVARVVTDFEDGAVQVPVVKFLQIEPLDDDRADQGRQLLAEAYKARTGNQVADQLDFYADADPDEGRREDEA